MSEDFRRLPKNIEEDPKMFRRYTNEFKYNLRDKLDITEIIDIFTCEDIISSHVRISYCFYQFVTTRYTTDFCIINTDYPLMFVFSSCKCENICSVASLQTSADVIVAMCQKVLKTQRRVILFLKILDVILKCGTEYSGFEPVGLQKWCLKLATGKYKIKGK